MRRDLSALFGSVAVAEEAAPPADADVRRAGLRVEADPATATAPRADGRLAARLSDGLEGVGAVVREAAGAGASDQPRGTGSEMMNTAVLFSTGKDDWQTPPELFAQLDAEFGFTLDVAANQENSLCDEWAIDGLACDWRIACGPCWCNPPYSRGLQGKFIAKAAAERLKGVTTVMLLPARTDTKAFHAHIWDGEKHQPRDGVEVRFLKGRLKFVGAKDAAPFPSMIVIFRGVTA